ncbi:MAG: ATP-binding cassette domain-containing protein [Leptolyngbyaceae cyanobacterium]
METPFEIRYNNIKLQVERLYKSANRLDDTKFPGLEDISFTLKGGECVHLHSYEPAANKLLLDTLTGRIRLDAGAIWVEHQGQWLNLPQLSPRQTRLLQAIGYLGPSELLCSASTVIGCVSQPQIELGVSRTQAEEQSHHILDWVGLPRRLWHRAPKQLAPAELHQVNLARTFAVDHSIIVIDLPLTQLDPANQTRLLKLIAYRKAQDVCFIGQFDQEDLRTQICDRTLSIYVPTLA